MIERDVGDRRHSTLPHVRGVKAATDADLDYADVHSDPREVEKRGGRQDLELGRRPVAGHELLVGIHDFVEERHEVLDGDGLARHLDPFAVRNEVRLGGLAGSVTGLDQGGRDERLGRALAVSSGNEDATQRSLWIAQGTQQSTCARQAEAHTEPATGRKPLEEREVLGVCLCRRQRLRG